MLVVYSKLLTNPDLSCDKFREAITSTSLTVIVDEKDAPELDHYPPELKELKFTFLIPCGKKPDKQLIFPDTILKLELNTNYLAKLITLPKYLEELTLGYHFFSSIFDINFPQTLTHLTFASPFCRITTELEYLPRTLTHLIFNEKFTGSLKNVNFPQTLTHLVLSDYYRGDINNVNFPKSLRNITLGKYFNKDITNTNLLKQLSNISFFVKI